MQQCLKMDAKRQLSDWLNSVGFYVVFYIGYCEATNIRTYSRDAIASALRALDDAKAEIESLEVNK